LGGVEHGALDVDGLDSLGDEAVFSAPPVNAQGKRNGIIPLAETASVEVALGVWVLDAGRPTDDDLARRFAQPPNGFAVITRCLPNLALHAANVADQSSMDSNRFKGSRPPSSTPNRARS
jgi:hypothetical protein